MSAHIADGNARWAQTLAAALPRPAVISPGSRNTPLVLALADSQASRVDVVLDERAAGFYALGMARATRRAVILLCTSGSAGAHYLPAIIEAHASGVPLIVITADRPPELQHCGAPQTIIQQELFSPYVRWRVDVGVPQTPDALPFLRAMAARALDFAEGAHPGPVHINLPLREPLWSAADVQQPALAPAPAPDVMRGVATLDAAQLDALADALKAIGRGVIFAGPRAPDRDQDWPNASAPWPSA